MDTILTSIKKLLGIEKTDTSFDADVIMSINTSLFSLNQLGVGPEEGYFIIGDTETWVEFIGERKDLEVIKTFIYLKTRLLFDPPTNAFAIEAMERSIKEYEFRLNVQTDKQIVEGGS